jgi:hypothetical protein
MMTRRDGREIGMLLLVLIGLALPILPLPGDAMSRMDVQFRLDGMRHNHSFGTRLPRSVCAVIATTLAFKDTASGAFTDITCTR